MTCEDCAYFEGCNNLWGLLLEDSEYLMNEYGNIGLDVLLHSIFSSLKPKFQVCPKFKDRSRFVELPFPISEGTKLYYIFEEIDGKIKAGKDRETVTRVCKDGFYVSGRIDSDGTYRYGDDFYPWEAIGTEYFFTLEEAEQALKEREKR